MLTHSRENVPRTAFTYTAFTYTAYIRHIIVHLLYRFYPGQGQTGLNGSLVYSSETFTGSYMITVKAGGVGQCFRGSRSLSGVMFTSCKVTCCAKYNKTTS